MNRLLFLFLFHVSHLFSARLKASNALLSELKGHLSAITDLQYSFSGDRLLTASQKDGVVRIWSWNVDPSMTGNTPRHSVKLSHILIKLVNPNSKKNAHSDGPRRAPNRQSSSSSTPVSCDVAAWVRDDTKIVTSQCELVRQSGAEIVPGSQFLCVWDSFSGHCLVAINGAHQMQCPVVVSHPFDPSILCTAGADGFVKVWDLKTGTSFYAYKNTVNHGPVEFRDRGKIAGFLDGTFYPDGSGLVLTDDSGRVTVIDCAGEPDSSNLPVSAVSVTTNWMKEQYFANDYYELFYDSNGYCVERGSEQPPHLAPVGVRCSHGGAPWSTAVNDAFKGLSGPLPVGENEARWRRLRISSEGRLARKRHFDFRGNVVRQCDPVSTLMIDARGNVALPGKVAGRELPPDASENNSTERLSSNYRWRDFNDLMRDRPLRDDEEPESDDEEFELQEGRSRRSSAVDGDSDDSDDLVDITEETPERLSKRRPRKSPGEENEEDSEDEFAEIMSTNNDPSGPFISDYVEHYFRISQNATVHREWLRRLESNSSYFGRKTYSPQVGDEVVYIPRAHRNTLANFPSLHPPWQSWPQEAVWPVVRCCVRHIRYRFPYKAYFAQRTNPM